MFELFVKSDGTIVRLVDTRTNSECKYVVKIEPEKSDEPHPNLVLSCHHSEKLPKKLLEELNAIAPNTIALLPLFNGGMAHVLPAETVPKNLFYPVKNAYATCLSMVEINTRRAGGVIDDSFPARHLLW